MVRPFRLLFAALFTMGLLTFTSCCCRSQGDSCCSPCVSYPAQPSCGFSPATPCGTPSPTWSAGNPPSRFAQPLEPSCCLPSKHDSFAPCGPEFYPCGSGKCGAINNRAPNFPEEICYRNMRSIETCDDCHVWIRQSAPEFATVGSPYPIEIQVTAVKDCADVRINQTLPQDAAFIQSEPPTCPEGNCLAWSFPHLEKGECKTIRVWVKPEKEGCCLALATVCACPQICTYTTCGQPIICIKKQGPECACLYCPIRYTIDVCNSGSATAYNVVVTDNVPAGLSHQSGMRCLRYDVGALCPGESKKINLEFCAVTPGTVCNNATVTYCGGPDCTAEACTVIYQPCVEVTKTGPDWAYICKTVDYTITVTNPGEMVLRDVVVDDVSAAGTTIVAAPGAEVCCNRAIWCISELCPGECRTFTLTVKSQVTGNLTNRVTVTTHSDCGTCCEAAEATTLWKGIPALHMCMIDTVDPICVGETTVYRVCVTNRGSAEDHNVKLVVRFSDHLQPQSVNGPSPGTISGNVVTFEPIGRMMPKQSVEYCVTVKAVSVGDAQGEATLTSDSLSAPDVDIETTHVY